MKTARPISPLFLNHELRKRHGLDRLGFGGPHWDVIHFNWGLNDLKVTPQGERQVPIETNGKKLAVLVQRLKATGARLMRAEIAPVPEGKQNPVRESSDVPRYNAVARRLMESKGIVTDDLYAAALPPLAEIQLPLNVHFNNAGREALGSEVAAATSGPL